MYYTEETVVFWNGEFVKAKDAKVGLYNQTMHYGNGVFEGIRSYDTPDGTRIFKAKEHYDRLHYSAEKMHIQLSYTSDELETITYRLLELNGLKDAYVRPLVYLGENMSLTPTQDVHVVIMAWEWGKYLGDSMLKVMLSSYQRPNPKACHVQAKVVGHYTNSILATTEAKQKGFDEALLTDIQGNIAEGPGANFFYEKDGVLYTAPLGNILSGITRATVFEIAEELGIQVVEKLFKPEEIYTADAAFFCGTAAEVIGIAQFNDYKFPLNWEDSNSHLIQRKYKRRVAFNEYRNVYL
ncbi:MAG: branched-chain amino acid transaminase [Cryomorphaceae bacterium]|jgi:branched-chain amino acid aminotransferase|nr:branched-chain amino acid transaminase [Cryomorphaceae bacterium]